MKKKKYLLLILLIFFFKISYTNASIQNKIIATVNNEIITSYELKNKIMTFLILNKVEVNQENINNYKNQSLKTLINMRIRKNELVKYNLLNGEIDTSRLIEQQSKKYNFTIEEFKKEFLNNNLSYDLYLQEIQLELGWQQLILQLYGNKIIVDEYEIDEELKKIIDNQKEMIEYRLSEIEVQVNDNEKITNLGKPRQPYLENAFDEYYYTQRTNIGSDINIQNNNDKIRILLAYNKFTRFKETFYTDLTDLSKILVQDESAQDTSIFDLLMAKIMISRNDNAKLNYQIGIDVEQQSANGKRILDNYQEQSDYAFFSTVEYKLNNIVSIRPSSRIIYNTKYKAPIIPALNILYDFNKYKLRISYAKGFRAPELKELFLYFVDINHNIVGNPLLFAEESNNYSLNATINKEIFKTSTTTDINVFYNDISNKIELTNSAILAEQYSYFNIDNYLTKGISASTKLSIKKTELNFGISYTGRYNNLNTTFNTPKFNYTMDYSISTFFSLGAKTKVNIFFKNIGKSPVFIAEDNIVIESYSEQYSLLDISINRRIYNDALIFSIGAKNLFDVTNIRRNRNNSEMHSTSSNSASIGYGRSFFTSLKLRL